MASLSSITDGQMTELKRVLSAAGLDSDLAGVLIRQPQLAGGMVGWLREQLAPSLSRLFVPLDVQLANYRRWNTGWRLGFTEADFDAIDLSGTWYHGGLVVDVIVGFLPDQGVTGGIQRSFDTTWDIASSRQPGKLRSRVLLSDPEHLRLLEGILHTPGLRRVTIDLGANRGDVIDGAHPFKVRGKDSAHAEVLDSAAHFPRWIKAMNGENIPYAWLPGYRLNVENYRDWHRLPYILWDSENSEVHLMSGWEDDRTRAWACPEVVRM